MGLCASQSRPKSQTQQLRLESEHGGQSLKIGPEIFVTLKQGSISDFYKIDKSIGSGAFGEVRLVVHKSSGQRKAMKQIRKDKIIKEDEESMISEVSTLKLLDHPNIVKLHDLFQDQKNYYLVTEYLEGGELFQKITDMKHFSEKMAADIMKQVLSAVVHCHEKRIVHRDIKPENILFENKKANANLKVIDFGTSRKLDPNQNLTKRLGTPYYIAPEVLKRNYNEKCDVWSCGIILYIMLCGYPPFGGQDQEILENIEKGQIEFDPEDWSKITEEAKGLILKMLTKDPSQRMSAKEAFNDPWIQKNAPATNIDLKSISNLSKFMGKNKVRIALMQFITTNVMSNQEKEELMKTFKQLDKDGNGQLNKEELLQGKTNNNSIAYLKQCDEIKAQQIVDEIFEQVDVDKNGTVDFTEFMTSAVHQEKLLNKRKLEQAFKMFDSNGDGHISREELSEIMGSIDDELWKEILQMCDQDGDGQISEQEFIEFLWKKYE